MVGAGVGDRPDTCSSKDVVRVTFRAILSRMRTCRCLEYMSIPRSVSDGGQLPRAPHGIADEQASPASLTPATTKHDIEWRVEEPVHRGLLIGVARSRLGSGGADAEDVVQETYLRWYRLAPLERQLIRSPAAWCVCVATRLSLDVLKSAHHRHERHVSSWPAEEAGSAEALYPPSSCTDPADAALLSESVSMAVRVVLESMTPAEQASFLLHDVLGYSFRDIGRMVGRSESACRKLAASARRRLASPRRASGGEAHATYVDDVKAALERTDVTALLELLGSPEVVDESGCSVWAVCATAGAPRKRRPSSRGDRERIEEGSLRSPEWLPSARSA